MAKIPASMFFKGNKLYGIGEIKFDIIVTEDHVHASSVSIHPIEDGSEIADHIQNQMEAGNMTGIISNFSLNAGPIVSNRAQDAYDALVSLWEERNLVTIYTVLHVYENVAIANMPVARDADSGESLTVQISFQVVKKVKLQEIQLDLTVKPKNLNTNANRQVANQSNAGRTTTSPQGNVSVTK